MAKPTLYSVKGYKEKYGDEVVPYCRIRSNIGKMATEKVNGGRPMIKDTPENLELAKSFPLRKKGPKFKSDPTKNID